jgi:hypothetical protein
MQQRIYTEPEKCFIVVGAILASYCAVKQIPTGYWTPAGSMYNGKLYPHADNFEFV